MVTISLRPSLAGDRDISGEWSIRRCGVTLFSDLSLVQAIRLARDVARDEYLRLQRPTCVEMPGMHFAIVLACYTGVGDERANEALVA
ncbi:hypothetical protein ACFPPA_08270 [Rhodanobacter ginsengisoli]|uniref:Uncharacterized protein n=1 Tax=Rhodanobacter ginsengisoli TaxID=418646 RepID=A0ABW0QLZ1_9GAMM